MKKTLFALCAGLLTATALNFCLTETAVAGGHLGDYSPGDTIDCKFTTYRPSTGASFTLAGSPVISAYKDNSTSTESTTGVTLTVDFDSRTGANHIRVTTGSDGTFYSAGSHFELMITAGTVDSVSVVGSVPCSFSLRKDSALKPTVSGRTLKVASTGEAGIDLASVALPVGAIPAFGIADNGVSQSVGATSITLRSAASLSDDALIGKTVALLDGANVMAEGVIRDYVNSSKVATIGGWNNGATPTGTPAYMIFMTAPSDSEAILQAIFSCYEPDGAVHRQTTNCLEQSPVTTPAETYTTSSSGSTTGLTASALPYTSADAIINRIIRVTSGANTGWDGCIGAYNQSTKAVTFRNTAPASIASGVTFELTKEHCAAQLYAGTHTGSVIGSVSNIAAQTGDSFARLGAPAGASHAADNAAIQADTDNIQTRLPATLDGGRMNSVTNAMGNNVMTAAAAAADLTTELQTGIATAAAVSSVPSAVWSFALNENAAPPSSGSAASAWLTWPGMWNRNKIIQTPSTKTLRNDADNANVATCAVGLVGTTLTVEECAGP